MRLFPYSEKERLQTLFVVMVAFALLGPTFGIPVTPNFKLTLFRVTFFVLLGLLLFQWAFRHRLDIVHMNRIRSHLGFFGFWLAYSIVSLTWAMDPGMGIRYTIFLFMMVTLCLTFPFFIRSEESLWRISRAVFWTFFVIVVYGVFESVTHIHLPSSRYWGQNVASITSVFTNQNDLATAITLLLPFLGIALYGLRGSLRLKGLVYLTIVFALYCLLVTGSRGNTFFALPLMIIVWFMTLPFTVPREKLVNWRNWLKGAGVVISIAVIVGFMYMLLFNGATRYKLATSFGIFLDIQGTTWNVDEWDGQLEAGAGTQGMSIIIRWYLLMYGLRFLRESHFMGVGAGNVEAHMEAYRELLDNKVNIHNWWAEVLVNFGVIVFALYVIFYAVLLWRLWKLARLKTSPQVSPLVRWGAHSSMLALIGYLFGGMVPSTAIHFTPMWIVYGIALAVVVVGELQKARRKGTVGGPAMFPDH
ncbi:O-antigen ligase family protein [Planifilum fimeticola]